MVARICGTLFHKAHIFWHRTPAVKSKSQGAPVTPTSVAYRTARRWALAVAPAGVAPGAATPVAAATTAHRGTLFIVGGGPQPKPLVEEFVRLAGGPGKA